jgi:hypothetical protein
MCSGGCSLQVISGHFALQLVRRLTSKVDIVGVSVTFALGLRRQFQPVCAAGYVAKKLVFNETGVFSTEIAA